MDIQLTAIHGAISSFRSGEFTLQETQRRVESLVFGILRADVNDDRVFRRCINELEVILYCESSDVQRIRANEVLTQLWDHILTRFGD